MKKILIAVILIGLFFLVNWVYHVAQNPTIILHHFKLASGNPWKSAKGTWEAYGSLFERHETDLMTAQFLAAIAQKESAGNPIATTSWGWKWSKNPFEIYAPLSSSAGLFQYTKPTFQDAKRFCVHWGKPILSGSWLEPWNLCWFNWLYSRTSPSDSIETTSARLHYYVERMTKGRKVGKVNKRKLATTIHLCGRGKAKKLMKVNFNLNAIGRCGSHNPAKYFQKVDRLRKTFAALKG